MRNKSKLGPFVNISFAGGFEERLRQTTRPPAIVKVCNSLDAFNKVFYAQANAIKRGDITLVYREPIWGDNLLAFAGDDAPRQAALRWKEEMVASLRALPAGTFVEGFNEPPVAYNTNPDMMKWYAEFEYQRAAILNELNLRGCLLNTFSGTPEVATDEMWRYYRRAVEACRDFGAALGRHEYAIDTFREGWSDRIKRGWLFGRYRREYDICKRMGFPHAKFIITELGLFHGLQQGHDRYYEEIVWADSVMQQDDFLIGACLFVWGDIPNSIWRNFQIDGALSNRLFDYIESQHPEQSEQVPMPVSTTYTLSVTAPSGLNMREGPSVLHRRIGVIPYKARVTCTIFGAEPQWGNSGVFVPVRYRNQDGWACAKYLKKEG